MPWLSIYDKPVHLSYLGAASEEHGCARISMSSTVHMAFQSYFLEKVLMGPSVRSTAEVKALPWHQKQHTLSPPSKAGLASNYAWHCQGMGILSFQRSVAGAWPSL